MNTEYASINLKEVANTIFRAYKEAVRTDDDTKYNAIGTAFRFTLEALDWSKVTALVMKMQNEDEKNN
ncbi:MAG: hypothetical protein NC548_24365 [Lachnospiraceae bacterium]|nr:hypothetical protein [Lachnospiraceae bacterium]